MAFHNIMMKRFDKASVHAAILLTAVSKMALVVRGGSSTLNCKEDFPSNTPEKNFTPNTKLPFAKMISAVLAFRGGTLNHKMSDFFPLLPRWRQSANTVRALQTVRAINGANVYGCTACQLFRFSHFYSIDRKGKLVPSICSISRKGRGGVCENWHLVKTENDHAITRKTDARFLMEYQRSILLELKERGALTEMQYRNAAEAIERQLRSTMQEPGLNSSCESNMK